MRFKNALQSISKRQWIFFLASGILLLFWYCVTTFAQYHPDFIEKYYSLGFYQRHIALLSTLNGWFPFSIAECMVVAFALYVVMYVPWLIYVLLKQRTRLISAILAILFPFSVFMSVCTVNFLPNYARYTFSAYSGLDVVDTSVDNLYLLCVELAENATAYRAEIGQENSVFTYSDRYSDTELFDLCTNAYTSLIADVPQYTSLFSVISCATPKPVQLSVLMSYLKINGFFFPITGEANINVNAYDMYIPATVCHELAHVAGFMREDEANFIGFLACRSSEDVYLNYSGTMLAFLHSTNALYAQDPERYFAVAALLSDEVLLDISGYRAYYDAYDTDFGDFSTSVNDSYLKSNNQTDGVNSYGRMVDLLIADYNARHEGAIT